MIFMDLKGEINKLICKIFGHAIDDSSIKERLVDAKYDEAKWDETGKFGFKREMGNKVVCKRCGQNLGVLRTRLEKGKLFKF